MHILFRRRKLGNGSCRGIQAASQQGLTPVRNDLPMPAGVRTAFRWGCTGNLPAGVTVVNSAESIHWCSDKRQGRIDMQAAGVSVPETWTTEAFNAAVQRGEPMFGLFVLRPRTHSQGKWLSHGNVSQIMADIDRVSYMGGYVSRLIEKTAEYRVAVIQNRVAWVAQKTPGNPDDVAWNVARGGSFANVRWDSWPMAVVKEALRAAKVSGTDFCGVDVMVDAEGTPYVLEINSAPSQTSPYRQSCFAKCFDYIVTNGKDALPDPERIKTYKSVLHPALREAT